MFNPRATSSQVERKDFKKLSELMRKAIGYNTIPEFANKCGIPNSAQTIANILHGRINTYPEMGLLKKIALGSEFRVSFDEFKEACNYTSNDNEIDLKSIRVLRGWICLCNFGDAIDSVQGGIRPALVIQNNLGNKHATITMAIPLTSRIGKRKMCTHIRIGQESGLSHESEIIIEQMRVISKAQLIIDGYQQVFAECPKDILRQVEIAIMKQTGIVDVHLNESVLDRFLDKISEYASKLENNNNYNNNYSYNRQPQLAF